MTKHRQQPAKPNVMTPAQKRLAREMEQMINSFFFGPAAGLAKTKQAKQQSSARSAKSPSNGKTSARNIQTTGKGETK